MSDPRFFSRKGPFTLDVIVNHTGTSVHGDHDGSRLFWDVAGLDHAEAGDLGFLDNSRYVEGFERSRAGACFVNTKFKDRAPDSMIPIVCEDPYLAFALAARMFYPEPAANPGVSDKALVDPDSHVGEDASIGAFAVISAGVEIGARCSIGDGAVLCDNVKIGDDCHIGPGATLMYCVIGDRVWIDAGARVGTQGFGFARSPTGAVRIPHVGRVLIGDDVEVGANTTIDRGSISDTIIENGTMIDNQVQIAHNVKVGRHAVLAGQAGLAGSAVIGDFAMLGGRTSVANHVRVGRGARMGGTSSAAGDLAEGETYLGTPAIPIREFWRHHAIIRRLSRRGQHVMNEETFGDAPESAGGDVIDIERVMQLIPHRYPFLMIDRMVDVVRNESAVGIKNVSINEPQFQGHFGRHPVMPGVYIIEAMAQSAAVLVVETLGKQFEGKLVYFMGVDKARFRKPVTPGDVMKVHVRKEQRRGMVWKFSSVVKVDDTTVAEAEFSAMILDN